MGLEVATEALRWGVNDLGGTLMEESISRLAGSYHGVRLDPPQLIGAAHAAGPPGGRAHDALRDPGASTRSTGRGGVAPSSPSPTAAPDLREHRGVGVGPRLEQGPQLARAPRRSARRCRGRAARS